MEGGSIVLNSISCNGVKCFTLFQKPSVYSVVSITGGRDGRQPNKQKHKTSSDHEGGENPEWDQTMEFVLDHSDFRDLFLEFRIKAQGNLILGDKLIGKSRVLLVDLTEGQPSGVVHHVSYRVQSPDGKPNGVLSFSYKLTLPELEIRPTPPLYPAIPSAPLQDNYPPSTWPDSFPSLPTPAPRQSLYPPLPLPEEALTNISRSNNQRSLFDPACCYTPPPPPPPAGIEYYHSSDRALHPDPGYIPGHVSPNRKYYLPPPAAIPPPRPTPPPSFATYYPPSASGYTYPPPQVSYGYSHCYFKKSKYEEELNSKASSNSERTHDYADGRSRNIQIACDYVQPCTHTTWAPTGLPN